MFEAIRKVVIPAAGLGTRFLPATKAIPKEMLPIVDVPTLQIIVEEAVQAGFKDVVVINGRNKHAIEEHFDIAYELEDTLEKRQKTDLVRQLRQISSSVNVISLRQKMPLGLGHAVLCAKPAVGREPFAVMLGDDIIDAVEPAVGQLARVARETGKAVVALMPVPDNETHLYGIAAGKRTSDRMIQVDRLVEKPKAGTSPSNLAIIGRYVLPPDVFDLLEKVKPGAIGEIQLTDALDQLAAQNRLVGYAFEGQRYDAGDRLGYLKANIAYGLKRPDLKAGLMEYMRQIVGTG